MGNTSLKVLTFYNGIFVFSGSLLGPLYAVYVGMLDSSILSVSLTWSVFLLSTMFFTYIVSNLGDSIREKEYLLLAGFLMRAVVWLLFIFVSSVTHLVMLQILLGMGEAMGSPAFDAIFAEHLDQGHHIREYANWKLTLNGVTGLGTLLGGYIVSISGFQWLFGMMSLLALVAFFGILRQPRRLL